MGSADATPAAPPEPPAVHPAQAPDSTSSPLDHACRAILDSLADGYFELDLSGRLTEINRALSELTGYPPEKLKGLLCRRCVDAETARRLRHAFGQVYQTGNPLGSLVFELMHADGAPRSVEISVSVMLGPDRQAHGFRGVLRDVTARNLAEAALARERNLLRTVIDLLPEQIYVKDSQSRYLISNPAVLRKAGVQSEADMLGKTDFDFFSPPELAERYFADEQAILLSGLPLINREEPIVDGQTGAVHWNLTSKVPLFDSTGLVIGLAGVNHDITDRRQAEHELQRRADEFAALYETARTLATEQDLHALLQATIEQVTALLNAASGSIFLYDPVAGDLVLTVVKDNATRPGLRLKLGEGMAGRVAQTQLPLMVDDYESWEHRSPQLAGENLGAIVQVPMLFAGELIGVLGVGAFGAGRRTFGDADVRLLTLLAGQAASAVHNARLIEETRRLARTDALTGVANRRSLFEAGEIEIGRARRFAHPLSAVMLDIDHFKRVNDAYGHALGDQVLQAFAQCCLRQIRAVDMLGRYGGEEFVILLVETDNSGARILAERIREAVAQIAISTAHASIRITASVGIAQLTEADNDLDGLLGRADQALYAAKQAGRNRVESAVTLQLP